MSRARARRWLRLDAYYCGGAAAIAVGFSGPLSRLLHVERPVVAAPGAATAVWALVLARLARRDDVRPPLRLVAGANTAASVALAGLAVRAPIAAARLLLGAVAVEVAAFAAVELKLLRTA